MSASSAAVPNNFFYLFRDVPEATETMDSKTLFSSHGLESTYSKLYNKKIKVPLSAFLPSIPGNIDTNGNEDNSTLRSLMQPPTGNKLDLQPLTSGQLSAFRLHPGALPEQYRFMSQLGSRKKQKHKREFDTGDINAQIQNPPHTEVVGPDAPSKPKKPKKEGEDKKKKKKDKRKKKN